MATAPHAIRCIALHAVGAVWSGAGATTGLGTEPVLRSRYAERLSLSRLLSPRRSFVQVMYEGRCSNAHDPSVGVHECGLNGKAVGKRRMYDCSK
jgi:hypothetical protein